MKFPFSNPFSRYEIYGKVIKDEAKSSKVNNNFDGRIMPIVEFKKCKEYYNTIGRVQNVTESFVLDIINRDWHFDGDKTAVKQMEEWEKQFDLTRIFEEIVRAWIVCGTHLISPNDWLSVQLDTIIAKIRDDDGNTIKYLQQRNGREEPLDAGDFIETGYINFGRDAWPVGLFHSLMNRDYIDIDGKDPRPVLELHRQNVQDEAKIKHKLGSPRVVWNFPNVGKDSIDNDIAPLVEGMGPGDRLALNMPEGSDIIQETLDGQLRFGEVTKNLTDEVTVGLQSSKTRLLTDPSAMADAKEAGEQDDDRILGIMKKLKAFMERHVIPRVTGMELGDVEFKWGAKDSFDLTMPPAI